MSDSDDIYDAPMAPASAQSGKVSQLARAFESCLKQPIMPQSHFKQLPPKTKPKMLITPSGSDKLPDMEQVRAKLRPVSVTNDKQQPEVTQSNDDQTESAQRPLPGPAAADNKRQHTYSLRKHSARESMFPPEVGAATVEKCSRYSQSTSGGDTSSVIRTSYGYFRKLALPPPDGAAAPDKPDIIDVDLEQFRRLTSAIYDVTSDDIYDDIAADGVSGDSFVSTSLRRSDVSRPDSRIVSTIPDMTEEEERNESGSRGTIFETIDSEGEDAEQEYDDVIDQDGEIYHDIK